MNIFINILVAFLCLLIGYLFGSISFAVIYGKVKYKQDIRQFGSGNAGATNVKRTWGRKAGLLVTILDMLKTFLPFVLAWAILTYVPFDNGRGLIATTHDYYLGTNDYIIKWPVYWLACIGTCIGHCWPLFEGFKGGKGAANLIGIICFGTWMVGFLPMCIYFPIKKKTKMVSFTVLVTTGTICLISWIYTILALTVIPKSLYWLPGYGPFFNIPLWYSITISIMYIIVAFRHKENIKRIIAGTERKDEKVKTAN